MRKRRARPCLACRSEPATVRGLCGACYQAARYAIRSGAATEADLQAAGLLAPAHASPRSTLRSELADWLSRRKRRPPQPPEQQEKRKGIA